MKVHEHRELSQADVIGTYAALTTPSRCFASMLKTKSALLSNPMEMLNVEDAAVVGVAAAEHSDWHSTASYESTASTISIEDISRRAAFP